MRNYNRKNMYSRLVINTIRMPITSVHISIPNQKVDLYHFTLINHFRCSSLLPVDCFHIGPKYSFHSGVLCKLHIVTCLPCTMRNGIHLRIAGISWLAQLVELCGIVLPKSQTSWAKIPSELLNFS